MNLERLWMHDEKEKVTWKYLGFDVKKDRVTQEEYITWRLNPDFIYKHLDKEKEKNPVKKQSMQNNYY